MAKIAQISAKYIIHATIHIDGLVDRPDVIGAIFGQTEGLLGNDLELRELQRSGRIGRIEVNISSKGGKSNGEIIIPSSLDKSETAIVGAALEVIQRIGPCNAKINVDKIEDIRISKRQYVVTRAKELLKKLMEDTMPDSQELSDEVAYSVRVMEIQEWGRDKLPCGPSIDDSEEIVLVEGRADVLTLLKHGFKNAIGIGGTAIPDSVKELCHEKVVTVFVDGDRGGDIIIKELMETTEIDFVTKAPDGKEVEELTKKELHKALRAKIAAEQYKMESGGSRGNSGKNDKRSRKDRSRTRPGKKDSRDQKEDPRTRNAPPPKLADKEKEQIGQLLEDLLGTHGAYVLDKNLKILGKVPGSELSGTIQSLKGGMHAVVYDGQIDKDLIQTCEKAGVNFVVGMSANADSKRLTVLTSEDIL